MAFSFRAPSLQKVLAIASLSFRAFFSERLLQLAGAFGVILLFAAVALSDLAPDASTKLLIDFGLGTIQVFTVLIGIALAANDLPRELERRTLYIVLSKPIQRTSVILGKFLGLMLALGLLTLAMTSIFYLELWIARVQTSPWFLLAIGYGMLEMFFLVGLAMLLSLLTSPTLASLYTLIIFVLGHQTGVIRAFGREAGGITRHATEVLFRIIPNLEAFNLKNEIAYAIFPSAVQLGWSLFYGLCLITLVAAGTILVFRRKEL